MLEKFTVADMAARLERASPGLPVSYYARQVRNWAQNGLFGWDVETRGQGRTAARLFGRQHLAMARLFSTLTRLGFEVDALRTVTSCFLNVEPTDDVNVPDAQRDLGYVVAYHELPLDPAHSRLWFLVLYAAELGEILSGSLTQDPSIGANAAEWMADVGAPTAVCLNVSHLLTGLFEDDETFERRRVERERFRLTAITLSKAEG